MSTSDQNKAEDSAAQFARKDAGGPEQYRPSGFASRCDAVDAHGQRVLSRATAGPAFPAMPDASYAGSAFETRLPQLGMPLPSVPAIPSAGKFPIAPDMPGTELSSFQGAPHGLPGLNRVGQVAPGQVTAVALPAAAPVPQGLLQYDPRSASAALPSSPFSLPMPEFDDALFPSFADGVPALPPLPPLRTEDDAKSALTSASPFYFLDNAGALNGSNMAPTASMVPTELSSRPERSVVEGPAVESVRRICLSLFAPNAGV